MSTAVATRSETNTEGPPIGGKVWKDAVAKAAVGFQEKSKQQWAIADAVLLVCPPGEPYIFNGRNSRLEKFGNEISAIIGWAPAVRTLELYCSIAAVFPPKSRKQTSFSAHREARARPGVLQDGMSVRDVEIAVKGNPCPSRTHEGLNKTTADEATRAAYRFVGSAIVQVEAGITDTDDERFLEDVGLLADRVEELTDLLDMN